MSPDRVPGTTGPVPVVAASVRPAMPSAARKPRPDPRPMRVALAVAAVAAASVASAGLVMPSSDASSAPAAPQPTRQARVAQSRAKDARRVRYVHLKPGQTAPPGARVIRAADPTPRVVIVHRQVAPAPAPQRRVVVRTRQSG